MKTMNVSQKKKKKKKKQRKTTISKLNLFIFFHDILTN